MNVINYIMQNWLNNSVPDFLDLLENNDNSRYTFEEFKDDFDHYVTDSDINLFIEKGPMLLLSRKNKTNSYILEKLSNKKELLKECNKMILDNLN